MVKRKKKDVWRIDDAKAKRHTSRGKQKKRKYELLVVCHVFATLVAVVLEHLVNCLPQFGEYDNQSAVMVIKLFKINIYKIIRNIGKNIILRKKTRYIKIKIQTIPFNFFRNF